MHPDKAGIDVDHSMSYSAIFKILKNVHISQWTMLLSMGAPCLIIKILYVISFLRKLKNTKGKLE